MGDSSIPWDSLRKPPPSPLRGIEKRNWPMDVYPCWPLLDSWWERKWREAHSFSMLAFLDQLSLTLHKFRMDSGLLLLPLLVHMRPPVPRLVGSTLPIVQLTNLV